MKISLSNVWFSTKCHLLMLISLNLGTDAWYCVTKGNSEFHLFVFCSSFKFSRRVIFICLLNECEVIYGIFYILNCGFLNQVSYDHRSYEHNLSNSV